MEKCLEVTQLRKTFPIRNTRRGLFSPRQTMCAVEDLSFFIDRGETYGLVGESGCGKSTTGRMIVGLEKPDGGEIRYNGTLIQGLTDRQMIPYRKEIQMVFQDTLSSLNPRQRIGKILEDILRLHGWDDPAARRQTVLDTLQSVGLSEEHYFRFAHELSGGQIQRMGIASALIVRPNLIICDEPVSALDVSVQAQILNMLMDLKEEYHLSLLFISHDIGVIRFISDRIGVMYLGSMMEEADTETIFDNPLHPYTKALLASVPDPYEKRSIRASISGEQPVRTAGWKGCLFCSRCPYVKDICREQIPELVCAVDNHRVACHMVSCPEYFRQE